MSEKTNARSNPTDTGRFATTHWTVVLAAGDSSSPEHEQALNGLCQAYWFPLYAYLRRCGHGSHEAEDFTQGFFTKILERVGLRQADPTRGKFRSFLLASLKNFLADQHKHAAAQKRGGPREVISLNIDVAEKRYTREPDLCLSPERLFEKSWALTVLKQAMNRLKAEYETEDKRQLFNHLKVYLTIGRKAVTYKEVAAKLALTEGAVKVAVLRLRRRYGDLVRDEIAQTVSTAAQVDEEVRDLFAALAN
jgi:RNA polymerase sigma factor (sigma-70 family)